LARTLANRLKPQKEMAWFAYVTTSAFDLLRGKRVRAAQTDSHYADSPLLQKYLTERDTLSGLPFPETEATVVSPSVPASYAEIAFAHAPAPAPDYAAPSWDDLVAALLDPINATGSTDPLSRNFHWSLGLAGLPGRAGLNAGLTLNYNSLILTKTGEFIAWDLDRGFPTPGFRLGFPVIYGTHYNTAMSADAFLLIAPDGSRTELVQIYSNVYEAMDSSHLQLTDEGSGQLTVRTTDGTRWSYESTDDGYRCTQIKDRNGNYISVTNDSAGRLQTVTDTLGRVLTVNYDENDNPISITQARGGSTFTWATFGYTDLPLSMSFDGPNLYGIGSDDTIPVLSQVGLPDGSYYGFEYNNYGQVRRINYYAADDHLLNYLGNNLGDASYVSDCPRIGAVSVWAENWNLDTGSSSEPLPVTTTFSTPTLADCNRTGTDDDCQETVVTAPDGTEQHTLTRVAGSWDYGLPVLEETWGDDESTAPTPHIVKQRWVTTAWTQDNTFRSYILNPRVTDTSIFDGSNQKRTAIHYETLAVGCGSGCSTDFNLPDSVAEYEADASTVLRTTETDYLETTDYLDRRIIGLPVEKRVYAGTSSGTLMAKTGFYYDDSGFLTAQGSSIPQYDATNYGSTFYYRGNLWKIRQYEIGTSNTKDSKIGYNTTGSVILTRDPLSHDNTITYDTSFLAYPVTVTDADANSSTTAYNFYTGQKTRTEGPAPEGQTHGAIMAYVYDTIDRLYTATRVLKTGSTETNDANTVYYYATSGTNVTSYTTIKDLSTYTVASTITDGAGRTIATATEHPGSSGGYKAQTVHYDIMGRADQTSNPTEISGGFTPYGDDYTAGWQYTEQTYDWKGRPLVTTHPDGTTRTASYSGCGCAGGEVVALQDEGTVVSGTPTRRKQKIYSDVLGRTLKTESYEWDGTTVYATAKNTYDVLDQVTQIRQFAGDDSSSTYQDTTYSYDGYGRLHQSHRPEQFETDSISLLPNYTYTTYAYNADDTTASVTDARGAATSFTYDNRRLVTDVDYSVPGSSSIPVPASVDYAYDGTGNRTSMTDGLGTVTYAYDQLSRLTNETRDFTDTLSNEPMGHYQLQYTYDLLGLASITDPFGATVEYAHDAVGQLTEITGSGNAKTDDYASDFVYRAWGALKSMSYGNGNTAAMSYNERLQPTEMEIPGVMHNEYEYNADGALTFSRDLMTTNSRFDRLMKYDHQGRLEMTRTGAEARNPSGTPTNDRPYKEDLSYDAFNNLTNRSGKFWWLATPGSGLQSYANNRNGAWTYDVDGRILASRQIDYEYDAAGRISTTTANRSTITNVYDGDGKRVKIVNSMTDTDVPPNTTTVTSYQLPSTIFGQTVTLLDSTGAKVEGYVFGGATGLLAQEKPTSAVDKVLWHLTDAAGFHFRKTNTLGNVEPDHSAELDPFNTNVDLQAPGAINPPPLPGEATQGYINSVGFGSLFAHTLDRCFINGQEQPCQLVMRSGEASKTVPISNMQGITIGNVRPLYAADQGRYIGSVTWNMRYGWLPTGTKWTTVTHIEAEANNVPDGTAAFLFPGWFAEAYGMDGTGIEHSNIGIPDSSGNAGADGGEAYPGALSHIKFISGGRLDRWYDRFIAVYQALALSKPCNQAFKRAGLKTPNELVQAGFYLAPRPSLTSADNNGVLGISEAIRSEANKSKASAQTIQSQFTTLHRPIIVVSADFFLDNYWKEAAWHELIHAGGISVVLSTSQKASIPILGGVYWGHDLFGLAGYQDIYDNCFPVLDSLQLPGER
jgi:YD repeat-containing protein